MPAAGICAYYYYFETLDIYDPEGFGNKNLEIENVRNDT